jgi:hypothetical protein
MIYSPDLESSDIKHNRDQYHNTLSFQIIGGVPLGGKLRSTADLHDELLAMTVVGTVRPFDLKILTAPNGTQRTFDD